VSEVWAGLNLSFDPALVRVARAPDRNSSVPMQRLLRALLAIATSGISSSGFVILFLHNVVQLGLL
jgi:hypothetical protein